MALRDFIKGDDQLASIEKEWGAGGAWSGPEDLLAFWAQQWYWGGDERYLLQIGLWMAEDLKLRGKVRGLKAR
jgi:hypothetical protein